MVRATLAVLAGAVLSGCLGPSKSYQRPTASAPPLVDITTPAAVGGAGGLYGPPPQDPVENERTLTREEILSEAGNVGEPAGGEYRIAGRADDVPPQPPPPGPGIDANAVTLPEQLVVEGGVDLSVDEVATVAAAIRAHVEGAGGRVINEQLTGGALSWRGYLQVKLPPSTVPGFLTWLESQGEIQSKRVQGTDVSRTLYDQAIALENLERTLDRLRRLLDREGLLMADILAIEKEMTRLRGDIERIKGEKRFLEHRVSLATLDVTLSRREGVVLGAKAKFYPGARLSSMVLLDPDGRRRSRLGGGGVIHTEPRVSLTLDVFGGDDASGESAALIATVGGATYSDFLGRGRRRFLNPYLGVRLGYAYLEGSAFAFGAGGGVELFKHQYGLVEANVNVFGFAGEQFDVAVISSVGAVIAF